MKKLFLLLLVVTSVMAMSCGPNDAARERMIQSYLSQTEFFDLKITYFSDKYYKDSSYVKTENLLILARDVYDAQRICERMLDEYEEYYDIINIEWSERVINKRQHFPYFPR